MESFSAQFIHRSRLFGNRVFFHRSLIHANPDLNSRMKIQLIFALVLWGKIDNNSISNSGTFYLL